MQKMATTSAVGILGSMLAAGIYFIGFELIVHDGTADSLLRLQAATCFCAIVGFIVATMPVWTRRFFSRNQLLLLMLAPLMFLFFSDNTWDLRLTKALIAPAMCLAAFVGSIFLYPKLDSSSRSNSASNIV